VLLFGGIETSEGANATALWHLLVEPARLAAVRDDPDRIRVAVEESLRLEPAAARVDRYATRDVELGGATIAAGDLVVVSLTAANRDPEAFTDPDRYDLDRPDAARHLAFARGPHACVAAHVARLEAAATVEAVLERLPVDLRLDEGASAPPTGLVFRKPAAVAAVWTPAA
jgi:cytochrome P450